MNTEREVETVEEMAKRLARNRSAQVGELKPRTTESPAPNGNGNGNGHKPEPTPAHIVAKNDILPPLKTVNTPAPVTQQLAVRPENGLAVSAKPLTLKEKILLASKNAGIGGIAAAIIEAKEVLDDTTTVGVFVSSIDAFDALYAQKEGFDSTAEDVAEELSRLDMADVETRLETWSMDGDTASGSVLETIRSFREGPVDVVTPMWRLICTIIRPAKAVRSYFALSQLLKNLYEKGLVERTIDQRTNAADAVLLSGHGHTVAYTPARDRGKIIPMVRVGWSHVKEAEARAKTWAEGKRELLEELRAEDTKMTPEEVKAGKRGKLFLPMGATSGVLIGVRRTRRTEVRILRFVGGRLDKKSEWMDYNANKLVWGEERIYNAFWSWMTPKK